MSDRVSALKHTERKAPGRSNSLKGMLFGAPPKHTDKEAGVQPEGEDLSAPVSPPEAPGETPSEQPSAASNANDNADNDQPSEGSARTLSERMAMSTSRESERERALRLEALVNGPHPHIRVVEGVPVLTGRRQVQTQAIQRRNVSNAPSDPFNLKGLTKKDRVKVEPVIPSYADSHGGSSSTGVQQARGYLSRLVMENLHDSVVVCGGDGTIVSANKATCALFGYSRSQLVGHNIKMLMPQAIAKHHHKYMEAFHDRVFQGGSGNEILDKGSRVGELRELKGRKASGEEFPIELTINPIRDPVEDDCLLIAGYIRDVSDRVAAQAAQEEVDKEKQMKQMAEYLLGYVNHEIRNPLQGMQGYIDIVMGQIDELLKSSDRISPKELASIERDLENLSHLTTMLSHVANDVMELKELESDKLTIAAAPTTLNTIIDTTAQYLSHKIATKSDKVAFSLKKLATDMEVMLDANRVVQIMINFLTNAIKYTERGEIVLGVELEHDEGELRDDHFDAKVPDSAKRKGKLGFATWGPLSPRPAALTARFFVTDTGRGIPADRQAYVFQAYQQVFASDARLFGGTGLGLHLCQLITHRMEGQIGFTSEEGKGSEFAVHLPIMRVPPELGAQQKKSKPAASPRSAAGLIGMIRGRSRVRELQFRTKGTKFLVVEDVAMNRVILKRMLEGFGAAEVVEAGNGKEAITRLAQDRAVGKPEPDVVFMDIMMPEMNGVEATKAMRSLGITAPIIGVTGFVSESMVAEALAAGMDKVLSKPCTKSEIAQTLADVHLGKWV